METQSRVNSLPPKVDPRSSARFRALVVEADYFVLTTREDPNVTFWGPGFATVSSIIPLGYTHIWISTFVSSPVRQHLLGEAIKRGIRIWKCPVGELRNRLLPFWAIPQNRSLMIPADPDNSVFEEIKTFDKEFFDDGTGSIGQAADLHQDMALQSASSARAEESEEEVKEPETRLRGRSRKLSPHEKFRNKRLEQLQAAHQRYRGAQEVAKGTKENSNIVRFRPRSDPGKLAAAVNQLPAIERMVFTSHHLNRQELRAVAKEFGLSEETILRIVDRVWSKLSESGIEKNDATSA